MCKTAKYRKWIKLNLPLVQEGLTPATRFPVEIHILVIGGRGWTGKERKDIDNVEKPIVDLLVKAQVIPDDRLQYISHVNVRFLPSQGNRSDPLTQISYVEPDETDVSEWALPSWYPKLTKLEG